MFQDGSGPLPELFGKSAAAYEGYYRTLFEAKPVTCAAKGTVFDALPTPTAVILDVSIALCSFRLMI